MATRTRERQLWTVLLAGPIIGTVYFFAVYLAAEAACADDTHALGTSALRAIIVIATAVSGAVGIAAAWRARTLCRDGAGTQQKHGTAGELEDNRRFMGTTAIILLGLFLFFVAAVAGPGIASTLC